MPNLGAGVELRFGIFQGFQHAGETFHLSARAFHGAAAIKVCGPDWCLRKRFRRVFIERLGHERDQIADDARVIEQRLDNRVGEARLLLIEIVGLMIV
jgi:hypothetical protein